MVWVSVLGFANSENVTPDTLNRPIRQLTQRTDWLFNQLAAIGDGIQSVRLTDAVLTMGTAAEPVVGDFVYLDPVLRSYSKALASLTVSGNVYQTAGNPAYSVGLLVAKSGSTGVIALSGKVNLSDTEEWALNTLLEPGETFRAGPYYLSPVTPGKMTANPENLSIYLGYFADDADNPGNGGYALLSPQYKDVGEAHLHRAFPLATQPAGTWDAYGVYGFVPKSAEVAYQGTATVIGTGVLTDTLAGFAISNYVGLVVHNVTAENDSSRSAGVTQGVITANDTSTITTGAAIDWRVNDEYYIEPRCRLVVYGDYSDVYDTTYTLTLTDSTGVTTIGAGYPINGTGFQEVYLKWVSSDATEGSGLVKLIGYEVPVPVGTKGLKAVLENALATMFNYVESDGNIVTRRQWVVEAPTQIVGWRARKFRQFCTKAVAVDGLFSLQVMGGPFTNTPEELNTDFTVVMGNLYQLAWTTAPADGGTVTIGSTVYEFDTNGSVAAGHIAVPVAGLSAADAYAALLEVVLGQAVTGTHVAVDIANSRFAICLSPISQSVVLSGGYTGGTLTQVYAGTTSAIGGAMSLLVYDSNHNTLVPSATFWNSPAFYQPVTLTNGLQLMFVPFLPNATPSTGSVVTAGDVWTTTITDEAPGAVLQYAVDCDQNLRRYYPPTPLAACALTRQGAEIPSSALYPDTGVYQPALGGLYWNTMAAVDLPWASNWVSIDDPGDDFYVTLYLAHMRLTTTSVVTSARPAAGSPIKITQCGTGTPSTVGDLQFDLDLNLVDDNANLPGYQVYKQTNGQKLLKGPVVSKIIAGPGVSLSSANGAPEGCGDVTLSLGDNAFEGDFEEIALMNAKQEMIGLFPYIRLLDWVTGSGTNIATGFTAKFMVPITLSGEYQVVTYITLFGESDVSGTGSRPYAGLTFNYNVLRSFDPSDETYGTLLANLIQPATAIAAQVPMGVDGGTIYSGSPYVYKAFQPMVIHDNPGDTADAQGRIVRCLGASAFPQVGDLKGGVVTTMLSQVTVQAGNMVAVSVQRAGIASGTEYTGKLGVMRIQWRLVQVS